MDDREKQRLFDEQMDEWRQELKLLTNKYNRITQKMKEMNEFTRTFHETSDKLEKLYLRDIQKRKEYYQEHETLNKALSFDQGDLPDMS